MNPTTIRIPTCRRPAGRAIIAFILVATGDGASGEDPRPPDGFRAIFNGRDLAGWFGMDPHAAAKAQGEERDGVLSRQREEFGRHWRVEDGELVNDGTGPYATTEAEFGDVELLLEYRTVPKADSGIYLRGNPQVQIWDTTPDGGKTGEPRFAERGSGGLFNNAKGRPGQLPLAHADRPFGEWNAFRIRQIGDRTWVWLNDRLVVDGAVMENFWDPSRPLPPTGPIMLQTHGGEIRWRNLFIRELEPNESAALLAGIDPEPPGPPPGAPDPAETRTTEARNPAFKETFPDGRLSDGWRWIRGDPNSRRVRDGALEIRIEPGNMWGPSNDARNVLVRALPSAAPGTALILEATVENRPTHQYEQLDLVLYRDDSNMVKIGLELVDGQVSIVMGREENDRTRTIAIIPFDGDSATLRLRVDGQSVEGSFRPGPADEWTRAGQCAIPIAVNDVPLHLALQAYQGPPDDEHWGRISGIRIDAAP